MKRKASAVWRGGLKDGKGTISTESGVLKETQYSFSTRFENGIGTNPRNHRCGARRRFQSFWLIHTFIWLTLITGLAVWNVMTKKVALGQEWALIPLLVVPWAFAIHFLRRYLKPTVMIVHGELSVVDSLQTARISNRTSRFHLKLVGLLYVILIPVLVLVMQQLHAVGKVSAHELTSMAVFFGGVLLISAVGIAARYFGRLVPQQKQLDALLVELTGEKP